MKKQREKGTDAFVVFFSFDGFFESIMTARLDVCCWFGWLYEALSFFIQSDKVVEECYKAWPLACLLYLIASLPSSTLKEVMFIFLMGLPWEEFTFMSDEDSLFPSSLFHTCNKKIIEDRENHDHCQLSWILSLGLTLKELVSILV